LKRNQLALLLVLCLWPLAAAGQGGAGDPDGAPAVAAYQIRIKDKALRRLSAHRERIAQLDFLTLEDRLWIPATFIHAGERYKVRLRLRGDLPVHWRGSKQSYRVKFKRRLFRGRKEINLIVPWDKHYAVEWLQTRVAEDLGLLFFPGGFADVTINGEDAGLYYESEHPTSEYLERNGRVASSIFTFGANWTLYFGKTYHHIAFELPGSTAFPPIQSIGQIKQRATYGDGNPEYARKQLAYLLDFYELLTEGRNAEIARRTGYYLDLDKFARFVALQDFFGTTHGMALNDNTRLYLDPTSGKFEFIPWDTALWSLSKRAREGQTTVADLLVPEDPVFRKLFDAIPGLRARRDEVLRGLVARGEVYRGQLERQHAQLLHLYPGDERLRSQRERHDTVFRENLALLARELGVPGGRAQGP
jgi:spore coat protein CotH